MFFNLFKKKQAGSTFTDKTYTNAEAKKRACVALANQDPKVIFVAWFAETANVFKELFAANQLPEDRILDARTLHSSKIAGHSPVFLEHFPLYEKEEALVKNWEPAQIVVYNSLDEGLFEHFGGEKILAIMKQMGIQEDELIEHPLISKSIRNAQDKIAQQVNLEQSAQSQKEWIKKNIS